MFISLSNPLLRIGFNNEGREVVGNNEEPLREEAEGIRGRLYRQWTPMSQHQHVSLATQAQEHIGKSCFKGVF